MSYFKNIDMYPSGNNSKLNIVAIPAQNYSVQQNPDDEILIINSVDRVSGTSDSFSIKLPYPKKAKRVSIIGAAFPNSFYNVLLNFSDTIQFRETGSSTILTATVTAGSYTLTQLMTAVGTAMTSASANTSTYTLTVGTNTFLVTIATSNSTNFTILSTNLGNNLGFTTNSTGALTQTAINLFNIAGPQLIYIIIKEFKKFDTSNITEAPTFIIPLTNPFGSVQYSGDQFMGWNSPVVLTRESLDLLDISLAYNNGAPYLLNGQNWSMILRLEGSSS